MRRIGIFPADLDALNVVHIAGTKGKGSTAAFTSSILAEYIGDEASHSKVTLTNGGTGNSGRHPTKIGLFTSPHLRFVRERIKINNQPISEDAFSKYFFEVWDLLTAAEKTSDPCTVLSPKPSYFRYLTLMAFHAYIREGVDCAVIECGLGGEYDTTNVIENPLVTGITSLGIDHVGMLGGTIDEIAWHKAGIMKTGAKSFYAAGQKAGAEEMLVKRATEKDVQLHEVPIHSEIASGLVELGLQGDFQKGNASLAVELAAEWLHRRNVQISTERLPAEFKKGLKTVQWGGRCETRIEDGINWYIDGGHTLESIEMAAMWYAEQSRALSAKTRILIFNQQTRDAGALARRLHDTLVAALGKKIPFTNAVFCTNIAYDSHDTPDQINGALDPNATADLTVQNGLASTWATIDPASEVKVTATVAEAVNYARTMVNTQDADSEVSVLVTGSLHLVGAFLEVLETQRKDTEKDF